MSEPFEIQEVKLNNISKFMNIDEWYPDVDAFGRIYTDHLDIHLGTSKPPKKATINDKIVKEDLSIKEGVIFKYFFKEDFNQGRDDNNRPFISNFKHFHDGKLNKDFISHFIARNVLDLKFELDEVGVNPSTHFVKVFDMNIINAIRNYMDKKRIVINAQRSSIKQEFKLNLNKPFSLNVHKNFYDQLAKQKDMFKSDFNIKLVPYLHKDLPQVLKDFKSEVNLKNIRSTYDLDTRIFFFNKNIKQKLNLMRDEYIRSKNRINKINPIF